MMSKYLRLRHYAHREWRGLLVIFGLTVVVSALVALEPWPLKILVDYALSDVALPGPLRSVLELLSLNPTPMVLVAVAAVASLVLFALNSAVDVALSLAWAGSGQRMVYGLAADLFHRLQRLSLQFHARRPVGDSLSRLTEDTSCVFTLMELLLVSPGRQLLTLATVGAVAWSLDPWLTTVSFLVAPLLAASSLFFGPRLQRRARRSIETMSSLLSFVHQTLSAIPVVQAFDTGRRNAARFRDLAAQATAESQRRALLNSCFGLVNGIATTLSIAIILYIGGTRVMSGALSVGGLLVFLAYARTIQYSSQSLMGTYGKLKSIEASIDRVLSILDAGAGLAERPGAKPLPRRAARERGHVRLEGVTFGYEVGRPVLHEITLEAQPGETIALVGTTGAGKSTLVSLVPRFFDPWEGRVTFDGHDLRDLQLSSLRDQVALVLQEPYLLPLSIADNIAYGRPGAAGASIVAAARAANADGFIGRLPGGYETVVGERGATLSGGEQQRLAIARAFLKDAPVLILDEPTSALDAETETLLLGALERLMAGRTTFIIAHRLSTIRRAERIVVIDEGRVVEMGSHRQLLDAGGRYSHFHAQQFHDGEVVA